MKQLFHLIQVEELLWYFDFLSRIYFFTFKIFIQKYKGHIEKVEGEHTYIHFQAQMEATQPAWSNFDKLNGEIDLFWN